jgi:hypothetical protein
MISAVSQTQVPSRILCCLPGRLVVAWAVLGAAVAVGLMYIPAVYLAESSDWPPYSSQIPIFLSRRGIFFTEARVRVFGTVVYEERSQESEELDVTIDRWYGRVAARLAVVGGLVGALVGWSEQRRWRRGKLTRQRSGWLWLPASVVVFGLLVVAGIPGDVRWSLLNQVRWEMRVNKGVGSISSWSDWLEWQADEMARLAVVSVVIGWAVHVAVGARGVRSMVGRRPEQAADYGEDEVRAEGVK